MSVGILLSGSFPGDADGDKASDWLEEVAAWLESHEEEPLMLCRSGVNASEQATLFVQIHPCAEELEISIPELNRCTVSAKTSTAGPGYHIFVCELLLELGKQFQIAWDEPATSDEAGDDTGYFFSQDAEAVRGEMLGWLRSLSQVVVENFTDDEVGIRMVSMPLDYSYPDESGILTPIGPRDPQWFKPLVEHPEQGTEFFVWWPEGVGAAFFLGRAVCRLWMEMRWRPPITEDEGALLMDIHLDLERAYHLDPGAAIPWREWRELLEYLHEFFGYAEFQHEENLEAEIHRRADSIDPGMPLIGYRRGRVQALLTGGWSIVIPGEFAEDWEENGETWSAWYGGRTIWFTSWSMRGEEDERVDPREILDSQSWPDDGEFFEHQDQDDTLLGRAVLRPYEEDGESMWNLKAYSAVEGTFALCNIYLQNQDDVGWALDVWKSMQH